MQDANLRSVTVLNDYFQAAVVVDIRENKRASVFDEVQSRWAGDFSSFEQCSARAVISSLTLGADSDFALASCSRSSDFANVRFNSRRTRAPWSPARARSFFTCLVREAPRVSINWTKQCCSPSTWTPNAWPVARLRRESSRLVSGCARLPSGVDAHSC